ncbi:hypothetical protein HF521_021314 [Silurus meridionalis]|uniref:Uncharacterized protein n=1 Tax=Silurus meridionalis TaxID=175797 RepID=A0A8T0BAU5_SILME|nr:hypothetical protein HF521_021314 [Silurus meridionalis]
MGDGPNPAQLCTEKVQAEYVVPGSRTEIITIPTALLECSCSIQHFNLVRSARLRGTTTSRVHHIQLKFQLWRRNQLQLKFQLWRRNQHKFNIQLKLLQHL